MEVLEDPDEGSKPRVPEMEALEDLGVGIKSKGAGMEALEDLDYGSEVHGSTGYHKTVFRCQGENDDSKIVLSVETQLFEKVVRA